uniref:Protein SUPPRESSOR OF GENE SILENCING 3 n=1 Tax=Anthurium amnicola TaxID=1678845 RepID=A0A1D1YE16_9ARAE
MSSNRGRSKSPSSGGGNPSPKGMGIESTGPAIDNPSINQLIHGMADMSTGFGQDGVCEVVAKQTKNQGGGNAAKQWGLSSCAPNVWGHLDVAPRMGLTANCGAGNPHGNNLEHAVDFRGQAGRENSMTQSPGKGWSDWESAHVPPSPAVPPPLHHGWQWSARNSSFSPQTEVSEDEIKRNGTISTGARKGGSSGGYDSDSGILPIQSESDDGSDGVDIVEDTDGNLSDDYDSDVSQKSHETQKKNKWCRVFFETMDTLSVDQINELKRLWRCPACQGGSGAIHWFRGLQSLVTHAQTKGSKTNRVMLHREFAELLEEELQSRGASVIVPGETFGKWKGLCEATADYGIVWPPMVVVMNTELEQDENNKMIGMGNQELLEYFPSYAAVKARHSYGPHGHRGMSVLIFEASAIGYMEAARLHKHFADEQKDREAWEHHRVLFCPGGKRQLYGFLARKEDIDDFNQHSRGYSRLKFEMKSYQEMVVDPIRKMSKDNLQLVWLKNRIAMLLQHSRTLEESFEVVSQKLHEATEENRIVRLGTKTQHEENKEEIDQRQLFFKEQMEKVHTATEEKERTFKKLFQVCAETRLPDVDTGTREKRLREEEITRILDSQQKEVETFLAERDKLVHAHEDDKMELRQRYLEDKADLEKAFDEDLTRLMKKYAPGALEAPGRSWKICIQSQEGGKN